MGMGGRTVARLVDDGTTVDVIYSHQDHLGSSASATDASGTLLWREDYTPFGETRQNPLANANEESFTGHIRDTATGLTYMQARYYDPVIGRFLSNDPVGFAQGGAGFFNRYAYTYNDPVNHTDPTGMCPNCVSGGIGAIGGAIIGGGAALIGEISSDGPMDWGNVGMGAVKGGVAGGVTGFTGNPLLGAAAAGGIGAAEGGFDAAGQPGATGPSIVIGAATQGAIDGGSSLFGGVVGRGVGNAIGGTLMGDVAADTAGNVAGALGAALGSAGANAANNAVNDLKGPAADLAIETMEAIQNLGPVAPEVPNEPVG